MQCKRQEVLTVMPTYEYVCDACGHRFEKFQSMTAAPVKKCPECKGKTRRLIGTGGGVIFKGSGFYQTDYRSSGYREAHQKESAPKEAGTCPSQKTCGKAKQCPHAGD